MDQMQRRGFFSERGFITAVHIPYILLALAVLALIYFWNGLQARNSTIAELEQAKSSELAEFDRKTQQYDTQIAELQGNVETLETENGALNEQVVALKREGSHARALSHIHI